MRLNHAGDLLRTLTAAGTVFVLVTTAALAVRVGFVLLSPYTVHGDAVFYDSAARALLSGDGYVHRGQPTGIVPPGYPLFVALLYLLTGGSVLAVGLAQAALGAVTAGVGALVAYRLSGAVAAYVCGGILALYPHFVVWTPQLLTETLFIALSMLALWALVRSAADGALRWSVVAGAGLGGAGLVRTEVLPFIPIAVTLTWLMRRYDRVRHALIIALLPAVAVGPWIARNALALGVISPATESATVLWSGVNPRAAENHRDGYVYGEPLPRPIAEGATEGEVYRVYMEAVQEQLRERPHSIITSMPAKAWNMFRPAFGGSKLLTVLTYTVTWYGLVALALIGTAWGRPPREIAAVYAFAAVIIAVHLVTIAEIRYRMPVEAMLAVPAGLGGTTLVRAIQRWFRSG